MGEFTKGPWIILRGAVYMGDPEILVCTKSERDGWEIADVRTDVPGAAANARLIAAAPDLLEALEAAMAFIESHAADPDLTAEMRVKYAALQDLNPDGVIARARGEA